MKDLILNFLLRIVFGAIAIYATNILCTEVFEITLCLGFNLLNILTIGTLGISGFGLILGISLFSLL